MNLNATLFGQMLTFLIFIWVTMRFVWPQITQALDERQAKIAEGLKSAEAGEQLLVDAKSQSEQILADSKQQAAELIKQAQQRADQLIEEARSQAKVEKQRIVASADSDIAQRQQQAKSELMQQVAEIAVDGAEKLLKRNIDKAANADLLDEILQQGE